MTKIKIGLFGFGVVGQGIYEVVRKSKNAHAEIVKICVRDPKKPRKIEADPSLSPPRSMKSSTTPTSIWSSRSSTTPGRPTTS